MRTINKKFFVTCAILVTVLVAVFFYSKSVVQKKAVAVQAFAEYMNTIPEKQVNTDRYTRNAQVLQSDAFQKVASFSQKNNFLAAVGTIEVLDNDGNTYYCNNLSNKISDMIDTVMETYPGVIARHDQEFANTWLDGWIKNIQIEVNYYREDCMYPRLSNG